LGFKAPQRPEAGPPPPFPKKKSFSFLPSAYFPAPQLLAFAQSAGNSCPFGFFFFFRDWRLKRSNFQCFGLSRQKSVELPAVHAFPAKAASNDSENRVGIFLPEGPFPQGYFLTHKHRGFLIVKAFFANCPRTIFSQHYQD